MVVIERSGKFYRIESVEIEISELEALREQIKELREKADEVDRLKARVEELERRPGYVPYVPYIEPAMPWKKPIIYGPSKTGDPLPEWPIITCGSTTTDTRGDMTLSDGTKVKIYATNHY
jgi:hypothetical protein